MNRASQAPLPISVVIPCFNAAPFLADAIASVRAQTRRVDEIIVIDDGSTDGSAALAESLGATVMRHEVNRGNGAARNTGIRAARHDLVALLDADDVWLPAHCETVAPLLERYPEAAAAFTGVGFFGDGVGPWTPPFKPGVEPGPPQRVFDRCLRGFVGTTACILRRDAALAVGGFDEAMPTGVDYDMWLRLSARSPFVATWDLTVMYRQHATQLSSDKLSQSIWCFRSRDRAWRSLAADGDSAATAAAARQIRAAWDEALRLAWDRRQRADLLAILALAPLVPGSARLRWHWSLRSAIPPRLLDRWDRIRRWLVTSPGPAVHPLPPRPWRGDAPNRPEGG